MKIQENKNLVESYYSKTENLYSFKLVFKNKSDLDKFLKEVYEDDSTINYKTSSIVN